MKQNRVLPYLLGVLEIRNIWLVSIYRMDKPIASFCLLCTASSGVNWVYSTTMLQTRSDDEWRGRVAGTDYLVITFLLILYWNTNI